MQSDGHKVNKKASTETTDWYLQLWSYAAGTPSKNEDLIANADKTGVIKYFLLKVLPILSPFILLGPLAGSWNKIKDFYRAENKNWDKTLDLGVNLVMTMASVTLFVLLWVGLSYVAPYFLAVALGIGGSYAVFNVLKHSLYAYFAHQAGDLVNRNENLWSIPRQVFMSVVNILGLVLHLGYSFNFTQIAQGLDLIKTAGANFQFTNILFYGAGAAVTLATLPNLVNNAFELNKKTLATIMHPMRAMRNIASALERRGERIYNFVNQKPLAMLSLIIPAAVGIVAEVVSGVIGTISRVAALVVAPLQLLNAGFNYLFGHSAQVAVIPEPIIKGSTAKIIESTKIDVMRNDLYQRVTAKRQHLKSKLAMYPNDRKTLAKDFLMSAVEEKFFAKDAPVQVSLTFDANGSVAVNTDNQISLKAAEAACQRISPYVYQSFWRDKAEVKEISELANVLDQAIQSSPKPSA